MRISGPQIGGYGTEYEVDVQHDAPSPDPDDLPGACFDVAAFTDGEFPLSEGNPGEPVRFHLCSADQVVDFGLKLLEIAQSTRRRFLPSPAWSDEVIRRIRGLAAGRGDRP